MADLFERKTGGGAGELHFLNYVGLAFRSIQDTSNKSKLKFANVTPVQKGKDYSLSFRLR